MPIINTITTLKLKAFITCCIDNDLSVLGEGTPEELQAAFNEIISQYYEVKRDENVKQYLKLQKEKGQIELRKATIETISEAMQSRYVPSVCDILRKLYPAYAFTEQSYISDLKLVAIGEIATQRKYERIVKTIEDLDNKASDQNLTAIEKHRNFIYRLMDINKVEGVKYDMDMTVMEYAIAESRLNEHIENLKKQANNGRQFK
jgi:hypothetical protein